MGQRLLIVLLMLMGSSELARGRPSFRLRRPFFSRPFSSYRYRYPQYSDDLTALSTEVRPSVYYYPYRGYRRPYSNLSPLTYLRPSASTNHLHQHNPRYAFTSNNNYDSSAPVSNYDHPMFLTPEPSKKPTFIIPTRRPALYQVPAPLHLERPTTTSSPYLRNQRPLFSFGRRPSLFEARPSDEQPLSSFQYHRPAAPPKQSPLSSLSHVKNKLLGRRPSPPPLGFAPPSPALLRPYKHGEIPMKVFISAPPALRIPAITSHNSKENSESQEDDDDDEDDETDFIPQQNRFPIKRPPHPVVNHITHATHSPFPQINVNKPPVFKGPKPESLEVVQDDEGKTQKTQATRPYKTFVSYSHRPTLPPFKKPTYTKAPPPRQPIYYQRPSTPKPPTPPQPPRVVIYRQENTKPTIPPLKGTFRDYKKPTPPSQKTKDEDRDSDDYKILSAGRSSIPGEAGKDYPTLSELPGTDFSCHGRTAGFYADMNHKCQVYHYCSPTGDKQSFLCPNGTIYNQLSFVCEWWYNVDCSSSEKNYARNNDLYKVPEKKDEKEGDNEKPKSSTKVSSTSSFPRAASFKQLLPLKVLQAKNTPAPKTGGYRTSVNTPSYQNKPTSNAKAQDDPSDEDYYEYYEDDEPVENSNSNIQNKNSKSYGQ